MEVSSTMLLCEMSRCDFEFACDMSVRLNVVFDKKLCVTDHEMEKAL